MALYPIMSSLLIYLHLNDRLQVLVNVYLLTLLGIGLWSVAMHASMTLAAKELSMISPN